MIRHVFMYLCIPVLHIHIHNNNDKRGGRNEKLQPIDFLCNLWANYDLTCLWNLAKGRANKLRDAPAKNQNTPGKQVDTAVSFGRCGIWGKSSQTLLSSGIPPITMIHLGSY